MKPRSSASRYSMRGVSASKEEVHAVVDRLDRGLFPGSFCKVVPDHLTGDPERAAILHADGAGTKSVLAYLHFRETGKADVFRGIAQDSLVMNIDDLLCSGATGPILISNTINRNARLVPGDVLAALIEGTEDFLHHLRELGMEIHSCGGETADVGDVVRTVIVDSFAVALLPRKAVVDNHRIEPGLEIIGLRSDGQTRYEEMENSGIGSNGLTSARHDLLHSCYAEKYPEAVDPGTRREFAYTGPFRLEDPLPGSRLTAGQALLSPTRTYAPVMCELLKKMKGRLRGIIHCSGGGQTKCLRFGHGVHFIKEDWFPLPAIFDAIQKTSKTPWKEMFQVFNMGHRMELYVKPAVTRHVLRVAESWGVDAKVIGHTEPSQAGSANHLTLRFRGRSYSYPQT